MSPRISSSSNKGRNQMVARSSSTKFAGLTLAPLMEGPIPESYQVATKKYSSWNIVRDWVTSPLLSYNGNTNNSRKRSDLRLLLGVLGCPLGPTHVANDPLPHLSIKDVPIEMSCAQYIVQQYIAATGCAKLQNVVRSSYVVGRVKMTSTDCEMATPVCRNYSVKVTETGCFVLWQMMPDMWSVELVVAGSKVHAGSNGKIVWRYTPWLGSHAAKGPARPLRRALQNRLRNGLGFKQTGGFYSDCWQSRIRLGLNFCEVHLTFCRIDAPDQGLDPRTTARMFSNARCLGEKRIGDEDCFILKLAADPSTLMERSTGPAEIIRHVLFGYFSQRTGFLVYMEDSHLTRIQATGTDAMYWETTMETTIKDYRSVDGVMIAHSGRSVVTLFRFGEITRYQSKTRMEETWTIDDVVFNVPGLSMDCFIPPADIIGHGSVGDVYNYQYEERQKYGKPVNGITHQHMPIGQSKY